MASSSSSSSRRRMTTTHFLALLFLISFFASPSSATSSRRRHEIVLRYFAQQQFGVNEFGMVAASVAPANGTRQGIGLEVVYAYPVTRLADPSSASLGFVRGTSTVATNTVNATVFVVNTVVHFSDPTFTRVPGSKAVGLSGTFATQGEANFGSGSWEYAVTGGTGQFRNTYGYTLGKIANFIPPTANSTAKVTTAYETHLWI